EIEQMYQDLSLVQSRIGSTGSGASELIRILDRLNERVDEEEAARAAAEAAPRSGTTRSSSAASTSHSVTININGSPTTIYTASEQDSEKLVRELEKLERSAA